MNSNFDSARAGLLALYGSIFLLALNGIFAKVIPLDAQTITQTRSVLACTVLLLILFLQGKWRNLLLRSKKQVLGVYALGILLGLHWITYFHAMQVSTVAIGMLSLFSYPVITVVLEPLFKRQLPRPIDIGAALVVFFGVFLMVSDVLLDGHFESESLLGAFWGVFSAFLFSLRNTTQKYFFPHVDSLTLMSHQTLAVALLLIPFIRADQVVSMSLADIGLLILLACFSTAMAHTFLSMSLKRLPAKTVGLISCNTPVVGTLLAWLILGEYPSTMVYIGGALILLVSAWETVSHNSK